MTRMVVVTFDRCKEPLGEKLGGDWGGGEGLTRQCNRKTTKRFETLKTLGRRGSPRNIQRVYDYPKNQGRDKKKNRLRGGTLEVVVWVSGPGV